jgi:anaerobic magnesium-protoporphyrin IX monomethyl ester cyclase
VKKSIDCLFVAVSGSNLFELNKKLKQYNSGMGNIQRPFNSAIAHLGTYLHRRGYIFDYINSFEDERDLLVEKLKMFDILSVGISTSFCSDINQVIEVINFVRLIKPNVKIILGGPFIAYYVRAFSERKAIFDLSLRKVKTDFIVDSFYGEDILESIILSIKNNLAYNCIANIYYKKDGVFFYTHKVNEIYDLEQNNVDWKLFKDRISKVVLVRTSLSCIFSCSFCSYPLNAGTYKCLKVDAIEKELNSIEQLKKVKLVHFIDDTLNVPTSRFKDMLRMMIKNKYSFKWYSFIRCNILDLESVELMKESGCVGVFLGIESGNNNVLRIMNKGTDIDAYKKGLSLLNQKSIPSFASFIIGYPGETHDTVKDTISFIEENKPTFFQSHAWIYDTRTPISRECDKYQLSGSNRVWSHKTMNYETASKLSNELNMVIEGSTYSNNITHSQIFELIEMGFDINYIKEFLQKK